MIVVLVGQSALASFFKLCMLLIAFILILVASYYVTRWYGPIGLCPQTEPQYGDCRYIVDGTEPPDMHCTDWSEIYRSVRL